MILDQNATLFRTALIQRILASRVPIIVLDAVAGMGKSVLLDQIASVLGLHVHRQWHAPHPGQDLCLWDIPNTGQCKDLPGDFLMGQSRLILAKRPHLQVPSLDRADVYGVVLRLSSRDLAFSQDELAQIAGLQSAVDIFTQTAGWPLLLGRSGASKKTMTRFLQAEIAANLAPVDLVRLSTALRASDGPALSMLDILPDHIPQEIVDQLMDAVKGEIEKGGARRKKQSVWQKLSKQKTACQMPSPPTKERKDLILPCNLSIGGTTIFSSTFMDQRPLTGFCQVFPKL